MPDQSGPKPYRTTASGAMHFVFPGGIRATVSNNVAGLVTVLALGFGGWSWVQARLDNIWQTIDQVSANGTAVEQLKLDVKIARAKAEERALQNELDVLQAEVKAQRETIEKLAECVRRRQRCSDLELKDQKQ